MKKSILQFIVLMCAGMLYGQGEVYLQLSPRLGSQAFALNSSFSHPTGKYPVKLTRFEYYLTGVSIVHDGGKVKDMPELVYLVRPQTDSLLYIGKPAGVDKIEAISFSIGVDSLRNHLDPSAYLADHPLAPKDPEMHWGWASGYRFSAIEGDAGSRSPQHFEVHALGDENYFTTTVPCSAVEQNGQKIIRLVADYSKALLNVDVSSGIIVHATTGVAVTVLENFSKYVFSCSGSTSTSDHFVGVQFDFVANPVYHSVPLLEVKEAVEGVLTIWDGDGKVVSIRHLDSGWQERQVALTELESKSGLFYVQLSGRSGERMTRKLLLVR